MRTGTLLTVGFFAVMTSAIAHADQTAKQEKFCAAITDFNSDVRVVDSIGPSSTVAELRAASDRLMTDAQKVVKTASKIKTPTAKQFHDAANKLHRDVNSLPDNITIDQAKTKVADDIQNVKDAARRLATESGCPEQAPPTNK
ncbi:MAG: hypothetical protein JWO36_4651 [Myxococcales bacterium]|nr:hypothetical protein [Myxococcales bacterium]